MAGEVGSPGNPEHRRVFVLVDRDQIQGVFGSWEAAEFYADKHKLPLDHLMEYVTRRKHPDDLHLMVAKWDAKWVFQGEWSREAPRWKRPPEKVRLDHYKVEGKGFTLFRRKEFPWETGLLLKIDPMAPDLVLDQFKARSPGPARPEWRPKLGALKSLSPQAKPGPAPLAPKPSVPPRPAGPLLPPEPPPSGEPVLPPEPPLDEAPPPAPAEPASPPPGEEPESPRTKPESQPTPSAPEPTPPAPEPEPAQSEPEPAEPEPPVAEREPPKPEAARPEPPKPPEPRPVSFKPRIEAPQPKAPEPEPEPPQPEPKAPEPKAPRPVLSEASPKPVPAPRKRPEPRTGKPSLKLRTREDETQPIPHYQPAPGQEAPHPVKPEAPLSAKKTEVLYRSDLEEEEETGPVEIKTVWPLRLKFTLAAILVLWAIGIYRVFHEEPSAAFLAPTFTSLDPGRMVAVDKDYLHFEQTIEPVFLHQWIVDLELNPIPMGQSYTLPVTGPLQDWEQPGRTIEPPESIETIQNWWEPHLRTVATGYYRSWEDGSLIILEMETGSLLGWVHKDHLVELME